MEYKTRVSDDSTFTIVETGGKLSKALVNGHHATAESLANKVTFHLEVWATNDALSTRFVVSNSQYKKVGTSFLQLICHASSEATDLGGCV